MKVYSPWITAPSSFNRDDQDFKSYMDELKYYAIKLGYTGPLTGKIARFGVADGYAIYMYCDDVGIHACFTPEFADGYTLNHVEFINQSDIIALLQDY